jgi:hypothetical protein
VVVAAVDVIDVGGWCGAALSIDDLAAAVAVTFEDCAAALFPVGR